MTGSFTDRAGGTERSGDTDPLEAVGVSRRAVLQGVSVGAVAGLAGCSNGDDSDGQPGGPVIADPTEPDDGPHYEGSLQSRRLGGYSMRALARRMDSVRTPYRLRGVPRSDREYAPPDNDDVDDWHQGGDTVKNLAADFRLYNANNKGILDTHRDDPNSIGDVLNRHVGPDSTVHKVLAYNTWLVTGAEARDARAMDIGRMIGREGYDIAALSEVFKPEHGEKIYERVHYDGHSDWSEAFGPPGGRVNTSGGLYGLVGGDERTLLSSQQQAFDDSGTMEDRFANKGWIHMEIDLGPGVLDLYLTHTNSGGDSGDMDARYNQIEEMMNAISARQSSHPENVTMAVGDFNIRTMQDETELPGVLQLIWDTCELRDAWLTRGGRASSTFGPAPWNECTYDTDACACDDYAASDYGDNRFDNVFVQDPQPEHDMHVDLTRIRRRPFPRKEPCGDVDPGGNLEYDYMSDHKGLDFYLIASPK